MKPRKTAAFLLVALLCSLFPIGARAAALAPVRRAPNPFVCLTIDDGYNGKMLARELDLLREKGVRCTFFIIGSQLKRHAELWRQAVADGHEICYHTMTHRSVASMSNRAILKDVERWNAAARSVLGEDYAIPRFARLPGGAGSRNQRILRLFDSIGYRVVYWSSDTLTGAVRRNKPIHKYIRATTKPGTIILTHVNGYDVPAMSKYIDWLKDNFTLGRLSDAFAPPVAEPPPPAAEGEPPQTPATAAPAQTAMPAEPAAAPTPPAETPAPAETAAAPAEGGG